MTIETRTCMVSPQERRANQNLNREFFSYVPYFSWRVSKATGKFRPRFVEEDKW